MPPRKKKATPTPATGNSGRYVGAEAIEDDGEPFPEKMERLTTTLCEQSEESARLEKAIRRNLKERGYDWRGALFTRRPLPVNNGRRY